MRGTDPTLPRYGTDPVQVRSLTLRQANVFGVREVEV